MTDRSRRFEGNFAWMAAAVTLVILYGSLYPFHFRGAGSSDPFGTLMTTWRGPFGRGDFVANVLLYIPFGVFWFLALQRVPVTVRIGLVIFCGLALSIGIELLQCYEPGRTSALSDVYSNTIGVVLGSAAGSILFRYPFSWRPGSMEPRRFPGVMIVCWLGYRWFPYVPVIDLHKYWTAVKPLVISPVLSPVDLYRHIAIWLAVALLTEALIGNSRSRVALFALFLVVLFARVLLVDSQLSPAEVAGGVLASAAWYGFVWRLPQRAPMLAALFAGVVVIDGLEPFRFSAIPHSFGWIPFAGFMHGSVDTNVRSFFEKLFTYGSVIWLIARAGVRLSIAAGGSVVLVLCLRAIQVFLPGRSAEITDPILVLMAAGMMRSMAEPVRKGPLDGCVRQV